MPNNNNNYSINKKITIINNQAVGNYRWRETKYVEILKNIWKCCMLNSKVFCAIDISNENKMWTINCLFPQYCHNNDGRTKPKNVTEIKEDRDVYT